MADLVIPVLDMYDGLRGVKAAASKDDTRPHLACVRVRSKSKAKTPKGEDGQLDLVATNGHVIYRWHQRLEGATDRAFSLTNGCVKRILRELGDVKKEHLAAIKKWNLANHYVKEGEKPKPEPKEPTIVFRASTYKHPLGIMRLDVVEKENFPPFDKIFDTFKPRTGTPIGPGLNSAYVVQVCKNLQTVTGNKNVGIKMEFDKKSVGGDFDLPMVRFSVPEGASWNNGKPNAARQLTCLVMPMRI